MWIPKDVAEIEARIASGDLEETATFEAKQQLPDKKKNADIATDVAAMATDGGVIAYGIGEDDNKQLTVPSPIPLRGAADRVSQVVSTSTAEVPHIDVREYPSADDPAVGYLFVIVPQSARAPHQVIVNGDLRFYGRDARGNRLLTEGDIARLYERRQRWEVDREQVLATVVAHAPVPPYDGRGYVHAFTRPVALDRTMLERAYPSGDPRSDLTEAIRSATLVNVFSPEPNEGHYFRRHGADEWRVSTGTADEIAKAAEPDGNPRTLCTLSFNLDGRTALFCGRATDYLKGDVRVIFEVGIAAVIDQHFTAASALYRAAGYFGHVDIGLAITGLQGAASYWQRQRIIESIYPTNAYTRTERVSASELDEPAVVGKRLLRHFFAATTGVENFDPWNNPKHR